MRLVPHTGDLATACPEQADMEESFGIHYVAPPEGLEPQLVEMDPGDVLFFNGSVIHGSLPNRSDRFRRAFISHYIGASAPQVARFYQPLLDARGQIVDRPIRWAEAPAVRTTTTSPIRHSQNGDTNK